MLLNINDFFILFTVNHPTIENANKKNLSRNEFEARIQFRNYSYCQLFRANLLIIYLFLLHMKIKKKEKEIKRLGDLPNRTIEEFKRSKYLCITVHNTMYNNAESQRRKMYILL